MDSDLPLSTTIQVRDRCVCLHLHRAARVVGRLFDEALRPYGITNGQFSLLMALNRPDGPRISDLVPVLGMDRTTLTAALKVLERRGLVCPAAVQTDARSRRLALTRAGRAVLKNALPVWRDTQDRLDGRLTALSPDALRAGLRDLG